MSANPYRERITPVLSGSVPRTLLNRVWPLAGVGIALIANAMWIGIFEYGFSKLLRRTRAKTSTLGGTVLRRVGTIHAVHFFVRDRRLSPGPNC
jgi:hypothetical protein